MTRFVSIDSSTTKTGMAYFEDGVLKEYCLLNHEKNKDIDSRINEMILDIAEQLQRWKPVCVSIEMPKGGGFGKRPQDKAFYNVELTRKLAEILGAVRLWCVWKKRDYMEIMPSEWRKWLGMPQGDKKRGQLKELSIQYVKDTLGIDVGDDVADAICQGWAVINYYNNIEE